MQGYRAIPGGVAVRWREMPGAQDIRTRCPRCGYDLSGVVAETRACPECGLGLTRAVFEAADRRRLRRRSLLEIAILLLPAAAVVPVAVAGEWRSGLPDTALPIALAILAAGSLAAAGTLFRRAQPTGWWAPALVFAPLVLVCNVLALLLVGGAIVVTTAIVRAVG